jgi:NAD(P)-dependent dehydrogenase (short-subunit alcohol dehydrogenase family)
MPELTGRRALVTGGGRGIGRAVALDLARAGAAVAVAARTRGDVDAVARDVTGAGGRAVALTADVTRPESVREMFAEARKALGGVDILVSGAGIAPTAPVAKTPDALWRDVLETNLSGVFYCLREALPEMSGRGWGRIVHVASIAGKTGYPYIGAYAASKHGVLGLTKVAALEAAPFGVTVNAVCPGYVDTPMLEEGVRRIVEKTGRPAEEARRRLADMSPQKRLYASEEVSALVLFLCGESARGINGQALNVDGGTLV